MSQKSEIIHYLSINKTMTQGDLSEALYGDRNHLPNLYACPCIKLVFKYFCCIKYAYHT